MLLAFSTIIFLCLLFWWRNRNSVLINWPIIGMFPGLLLNASRAHEFATDLLQKNDGTFVFKGPWFAGFDFMITSNSMNVQHILSKNFTNYHRNLEFKQIFEPLGDGIFNSDGDWWKTQRRIIHTSLKHRKFELALEKIIQQKILQGLFMVLDHVSVLGVEVDLQDVLHRLTFDNARALVLGFDPNCLSIDFPQVPYEKAYDVIEEVAFHRHLKPHGFWKLQKWLQIGQERKMKKAWEIIDHFLCQRISRKRELLSESKIQIEGEDHFDLLTYILVEDDDKGGEKGVFRKSDKFVRDMAFYLLAAGSDTVASGLVWFLWLVSTHPLVEMKILEEIKANLSVEGEEKWRFFNFKELSKLVYLHAAICEALRLYPPVPFEHKDSIESDIIPSGLHIGRNTRIIYSLYSMGRMKEIWGEDCLEF